MNKPTQTNKTKTMKLSYGQSLFYMDNSRFKCLNSGRRFGKTVGIIAECLTTALHQPKSITVMTEPVFSQVKKVLMPELLNYLPMKQVANINYSDYIVELTNRSIIYLGSTHNYDTFRGLGIDLLCMDETADNEPDSFYSVFRPALSDRNGRGVFTGTPKGKSNWWFELTSKYKSYHYKTIDGGRVSADEIEMAKSEMDVRTFKQEYEASFETTSSTVFYSFRPDINIIDDMPFNPMAKTFVCFDFNVGENPLACLIVQQINGIYYAIHDYSFAYSNTESTSKYVADYLTERNFKGQLMITGDYAGRSHSSKASLNDYEIIGFQLKQFNPDIVIRPTLQIKNRVSCMNSMFYSMTGKTKIYICKRNKNLINDLLRLEWHDTGLKFMVKKGIDHSHRPDALSYLAYNFENVIERDELKAIG